MTTFEVVAEGLGKRYGPTRALETFDLTVPTGTVHGLLGPNGAGKTTAVRILTTLLRFDTGRATVAGYDVLRQPDEVRARIGLTGQYAAVDEILSGRQNLELFGRLFRLSRREARRRADELLERFGLDEAANRSAGEYSGGMRRRLDLAASLIRTPRVLFLDEPTTGLDPRSRNQVWDLVRSLVAEGTTVLLTTQYLEEADQLANRISVIDAGRVVAEGSPDELKSRTGGDRIEVVVRDAADLNHAARIVAPICGAEPELDPEVRRLSVPVADRVAGLVDVVRALDDAGIAVEDIGLRRATLDEAFLHLTGHRADEAHQPVGVGRKVDVA
ncbi:ATP-binding cassette domain-containing protein [Micromonospora parathelypteridis]|uniref:ABC-2 type transport system ATP-binding protein n=1 Tax=Micromonospora parathelypteridis TaxID=1839617 RepID=A0A840VMF0_9ACTN|nr:ATP-binding cassette domain-containing protein [Micromonospora parathelypteridis]MBB5477907.1 ABC-2 type transport system ATP-binding protein [Micromonospora parathelypteridis]GGO12233.1 daunorubicin resistance protein DrrA family ABC transporter ATP-binding protein [Micromonospora parathelypteridis]